MLLSLLLLPAHAIQPHATHIPPSLYTHSFLSRRPNSEIVSLIEYSLKPVHSLYALSTDHSPNELPYGATYSVYNRVDKRNAFFYWNGSHAEEVDWTRQFASGFLHVRTFANASHARHAARKRGILDDEAVVEGGSGEMNLVDLDFSGQSLELDTFGITATCAYCRFKYQVFADFRVEIDTPWYSPIPRISYFKVSLLERKYSVWNFSLKLRSLLNLKLHSYAIPRLTLEEVTTTIWIPPGVPIPITIDGGVALSTGIVTLQEIELGNIGFRDSTETTTTLEYSRSWLLSVPRMSRSTVDAPSMDGMHYGNGLFMPYLRTSSEAPEPKYSLKIGIGPRMTIKLFGAFFPISIGAVASLGLETRNNEPSCRHLYTIPYWGVTTYVSIGLFEISSGTIAFTPSILGSFPYDYSAQVVPNQYLHDFAQCNTAKELALDIALRSLEFGSNPFFTGLPVVSRIQTEQNMECAGANLMAELGASMAGCEACLAGPGCVYYPDAASPEHMCQYGSQEGLGKPVYGTCALAPIKQALQVSGLESVTALTGGWQVSLTWDIAQSCARDDMMFAWKYFDADGLGRLVCGAGLPCRASDPREGVPGKDDSSIRFTLRHVTSMPSGEYSLIAWCNTDPSLHYTSHTVSWVNTGQWAQQLIPTFTETHLTASTECTQPCQFDAGAVCPAKCGNEGVHEWIAPDGITDVTVAAIPCNRIPCPKAPIVLSNPEVERLEYKLAPDSMVEVQWSGGTEEDRFVVEVLAADCSAWHSIGVTTDTSLKWNPRFDDFYSAEHAGSVVFTRFRVSLENDPSWFGISPYPVPLPVISAPMEWTVSFFTEDGNKVEHSLVADLVGSSAAQVVSAVSLQSGAVVMLDNEILSGGYPSMVVLADAFPGFAADMYAVLEPVSDAGDTQLAQPIVIELRALAHELPCAQLPPPAAVAQSLESLPSNGEAWLCTAESNPVVDLLSWDLFFKPSADWMTLGSWLVVPHNAVCVADEDAIMALPLASAAGSSGLAWRVDETASDDSTLLLIVVLAAVACCFLVVSAVAAAVCFGVIRILPRHRAKVHAHPVVQRPRTGSRSHAYRRSASPTSRALHSASIEAAA